MTLTRTGKAALQVIGAATALVLTGCADSGGWAEERAPYGHMPPPGECRVWYPDRPPGQQPPPGPCHEIHEDVPPGASVLRG
ncbi:hypothetical protein ACFOW6_03480 [Fodinicurvata halophila]|uniref:Lipoprotein n=1 Tax=Fodinicurvata halophila TaxID=1419723 RepID=A0ABV8UH60_9PROT